MTAGRLIVLPSRPPRPRGAWERPDPEEKAIREEELRVRLGADRRSMSHPCVHRLFNKRCPDRYGGNWFAEWDGKMPCHPPATDHPSLWLKDGKAIAFVSEPYGLVMKDTIEMVNFAERWGLTFEMLPWASPHYPGHTMAVIWRRVER